MNEASYRQDKEGLDSTSLCYSSKKKYRPDEVQDVKVEHSVRPCFNIFIDMNNSYQHLTELYQPTLTRDMNGFARVLKKTGHDATVFKSHERLIKHKN